MRESLSGVCDKTQDSESPLQGLQLLEREREMARVW